MIKLRFAISILFFALILNSCADKSDYVYVNGGVSEQTSGDAVITDQISETKNTEVSETEVEVSGNYESETATETEPVTESESDKVTVTESETVTETATETENAEETKQKETSALTESLTTEEITNDKISVISASQNVKRGNKASLEILGKPNTNYTIKVYYSNSVSTAKGLEPKNSDKNGSVVWEWKVGTRTKAGKHKIEVSGGGEKLTLYFTTTE